MICYIALGSNLGDRLGRLRRAARFLKESGVDVLTSSSVYETRPVGGPARQHEYLNAVIRVRTTGYGPLDLLKALKSIEKKMGRRAPGKRNAPRPIDLDIIFFGKKILRGPRLVIPHPRFRQRVFVLRPLADIAPRWRDPVTGQTAAALLKGLKDRGCWRKLDEKIVP